MGYGFQTSGHGLQVTVYWMTQQHLDLTVLGCQVIETVISSELRVPQGCMQGMVLAA